jgi:branched-chain amino acid transport system substrate-binding protein
MRANAALACGATLLSTVAIVPAFAERPEPPLKIGLITDFSSVYSHNGGIGDLEAAKMAIEDFGGRMFDKQIELTKAPAADLAAFLIDAYEG